MAKLNDPTTVWSCPISRFYKKMYFLSKKEQKIKCIVSRGKLWIKRGNNLKCVNLDELKY